MSSTDRFFRDPTEPVHDFFDEGPVIVRKNTTVLSSTIDLTSIDKFRQGVEIQSIKQWDAGMVKIHSGEPGHASFRSSYGFSDIFSNEPKFSDHFDVAPSQYLSSTLVQNNHQVRQLFTSLPGHKLDSNTLQKFLYDGVLDPLSSHDRAGFLNSSLVSETGVRAAVMGGNETNSSELPFHDDPGNFYYTRSNTTSHSSDLVVSQYPTNATMALNSVRIVPPTYTTGSFSTIYEVDFTTKSAISLTNSGSFTIDGYTWWCKGSGSNGDSVSIVPGSGLRINNKTSTGIAAYPGLAISTLHTYFDFSQLASYDHGLPVAVQVWYHDQDYTYVSNAAGVTGLISAAPTSSNSTTTAELKTAAWILNYSSTVARFYYPGGGSTSFNIITASVPSSVSQYLYTMVDSVPARTASVNYGVRGTDGWGSIESLSSQSSRSTGNIPNSDVSATPNFGFMFWCENNLGPLFASVPSTLGGMRILQPLIDTASRTVIEKTYVSSSLIRNYDLSKNEIASISNFDRDIDMLSALLAMSSSTENYVEPFFRSAACGNDYNETGEIGTDSIAFGGLIQARYR